MFVVYILSALLLLLSAAAFVTFRMAFLAPRRRRDPLKTPGKRSVYAPVWERVRPLVAELEALPCERVSIRSRDGLILRGRYYHCRDGAPLQIQLHGYRSIAGRDFCGGHRLARQAGHNILLVDQRAHGDSEGRVITFGIRERYDCLDWARWAAERFDQSPILLVGVSMGAATVLMAAELPLPAAVKGIVADSPYTSPAAIIRKVCGEDRHIPPALGMPLIRLGARLFGGFSVEEASAEEAVARAAVPLLLLHGEADGFVPCEMSRRLAAVGRDVTLLTIPEATHAQGYFADPSGYRQALDAFTRRVLEE